MNTYIADSIARQHADAMLADAAAARRLRGARRSRTARITVSAKVDSGQSPAPVARRGAVVAHVVAWPFSAAHNWLAAGEL